MSLHEYWVSRELAANDTPFYALIMAAYRKADTFNAAKLRAQWPEICAEVQARYDAPGGVLPSEVETESKLVCRDCGKEEKVFAGWAFCGPGCKGDARVKLNALHAWRKVSMSNDEEEVQGR